MRDVEPGPDGFSLIGALDVVHTSKGVMPRRLPSWTTPQVTDIGMDAMVRMPAGVRLRLRTDATRVDIEVMVTHLREGSQNLRPVSFDMVVDGEVTSSQVTSVGHQIVIDGPTEGDIRFEKGEPVTLSFGDLPSRDKTVDIWLPHRAMVEVRGVRIPDGATVEATPAAPTAPLWVHYGSSISHCVEADHPTDTWPAIVALSTGVELVDLGFGANCMLDGYVARTIRDLPADLISLKLGINIVGADSMRERTFEPSVHAFLDTIREGHPETPLLVVSPILCPSLEHHPGPNVMGPDGRYTVIPGCEDVRAGSLTLERVRQTLERVVTTRRGLGDENLHYLDGLDLFGVDDAVDLPDDLHPNEDGYRRMAERFVAEAFGEDAPFRI